MHECQEIRSANINQKEDRFLIYERDLLSLSLSFTSHSLLSFQKIIFHTFKTSSRKAPINIF